MNELLRVGSKSAAPLHDVTHSYLPKLTGAQSPFYGDVLLSPQFVPLEME